MTTSYETCVGKWPCSINAFPCAAYATIKLCGVNQPRVHTNTLWWVVHWWYFYPIFSISISIEIRHVTNKQGAVPMFLVRCRDKWQISFAQRALQQMNGNWTIVFSLADNHPSSRWEVSTGCALFHECIGWCGPTAAWRVEWQAIPEERIMYYT